jgi:hypothetical protein
MGPDYIRGFRQHLYRVYSIRLQPVLPQQNNFCSQTTWNRNLAAENRGFGLLHRRRSRRLFADFHAQLERYHCRRPVYTARQPPGHHREPAMDRYPRLYLRCEHQHHDVLRRTLYRAGAKLRFHKQDNRLEWNLPGLLGFRRTVNAKANLLLKYTGSV